MTITTKAVADPAVMHNMLKSCLANNQAIDLQAILGQLNIERDTVIELLSGLVKRREVEVLCPVTVQRDGAPLTLHPLERYRLIRATDGDFLWETGIQEEHQRICNATLEKWTTELEPRGRILDFHWLWPKTYAYSAG